MNHGLKWIAAMQAPWTVSPHPNFSGNSLDWAAKLALLVEGRLFTDEDQEPDSASEITVEASLLTAARSSTIAESIQDSSSKLWALASDQNLVSGIRVAAACFAATVESELDSPYAAIQPLNDLLTDLEILHEKLNGTSSELRLMIGAVQLQLMTRSFDSGFFKEARTFAESALRTGSGIFNFSEKFEVSRGISWEAEQVSQDLAVALRDRARAALAWFKQHEGTLWQDVVRSRSGWIDVRLDVVAARANRQWIENEFNEIYEANSGIVRFGGGDGGASTAFSVLLCAEVSGALNDILRAREAFARVRALKLAKNNAIDVFEIVDAVRYLRQARSKNPLRYLLRRVRDLGPTEALKTAASSVLRRVKQTRAVSEYDLLVLAESAEFLDLDEARSALPVLRMYIDSESIGPKYLVGRYDQVWDAMVRFLGFEELHADVAKYLLDDVRAQASVAQPFANAALRAASRIDWTIVAPEVKRDLMQARKAEDADDDSFWKELGSVLAVERQSPYSEHDIRGVLHDLDVRGPELSRADIDTHSKTLVVALGSERDAAASGVSSWGSVETLEVAVLFGLRAKDAGLWVALVQYAVDPAVSFDLKVKGLMRLARFFNEVPAQAKEKLQAEWLELARSRSRSEWDPEQVPVSGRAEYLALGMLLEVISQEEALSRLLELSVGSPAERFAAARTLPFAGRSDWVTVLAVQFAKDPDPTVRGEAAYALGQIVSAGEEKIRIAEKEVLTALSGQGKRVKLRLLRGLVDGLDRSNPATNLSADLTRRVQDLASDDPSVFVRSGARVVVSRMRQHRIGS